MWCGPLNFVQIEHLPSGMTTRADFTRSMFRCKEACVMMLRGKLWSLERAAETGPVPDAQRAIADHILRRSAPSSDERTLPGNTQVIA